MPSPLGNRRLCSVPSVPQAGPQTLGAQARWKLHGAGQAPPCSISQI